MNNYIYILYITQNFWPMINSIDTTIRHLHSIGIRLHGILYLDIEKIKDYSNHVILLQARSTARI